MHFGDGSTVNNGFEALFTTTHTGSLEEYISAFEGRVSQLPVLSDELYLGAFLGGLKKEIRVRLQDATLTDYPAAIHMAKKLELVHPTHQSSSPSRPVVFSQPSIRSAVLQQISSPVSSPPQPTPTASSQDSSAPRLVRHICNMWMKNTGSIWLQAPVSVVDLNTAQLTVAPQKPYTLWWVTSMRTPMVMDWFSPLPIQQNTPCQSNTILHLHGAAPTWMDTADVRGQYLDINLEDMAVSSSGALIAIASHILILLSLFLFILFNRVGPNVCMGLTY